MTQETNKFMAAVHRVAVRTSLMAAAWGVIGLIAGLNAGHAANAGAIGYLAHIVASVIVFPILGVVLGLFSVRWREAFVGALAGFLMAAVASPGVTEIDAITRGAGLNVGGIVGVTSWPLIRFISGLLQWPVSLVR